MTAATGVSDSELESLLTSIAGASAEPEDVADTVKRIVAAHSAAAPRSQQKAIGLSELGDPCDRFIAYKAFGIDAVNTGQDNWLANVGTACHSWLEAAFRAENKRLGRRRFILEETIYVTDSLYGHGDLYDADAGAVWDHKLLGTGKLKEIRDGKIPPRYRAQIHLYGAGHRRAGRPVRIVGLLVYPRNDSLRGDFGGNGLVVHREPYDERIPQAAIRRVAHITELAVNLDVEDHPERWAAIPASPSEDCKYCPFWRPGGGVADATGCPGQPTTMPTTMPGLVT